MFSPTTGYGAWLSLGLSMSAEIKACEVSQIRRGNWRGTSQMRGMIKGGEAEHCFLRTYLRAHCYLQGRLPNLGLGLSPAPIILNGIQESTLQN